ncbi:class III signal peptide-containing protein [Candidatus Woesearchaeota archaeon]|nr:class III signal peptide-containing protein [Candidatus Woesearchaeota archaeon]
MNKRGQIAVEYMVIMGVILIVLSPFVYKEVNKYIVKARINDANNLISGITKSADSLYSLGPGNQKHLYIDVPKGVTDVNIYGREIVFAVDTPEGSKDIIMVTKGYVTGVIPIDSGVHKIKMRVLETGVVLIGDPYCVVLPTVNCTDGRNPVLFLHEPGHSTHASIYNETDYNGMGDKVILANYSICCIDTVKGDQMVWEENNGWATHNTTMFRLDNLTNAHVAEKDYINYTVEAKLYTNKDVELNCEYTNESVQYCAEFGQDYYCLATIDNTHYSDNDGGENYLTNSHISDCDGDWDDYPVKVCCLIPPR